MMPWFLQDAVVVTMLLGAALTAQHGLPGVPPPNVTGSSRSAWRARWRSRPCALVLPVRLALPVQVSALPSFGRATLPPHAGNRRQPGIARSSTPATAFRPTPVGRGPRRLDLAAAVVWLWLAGVALALPPDCDRPARLRGWSPAPPCSTTGRGAMPATRSATRYSFPRRSDCSTAAIRRCSRPGAGAGPWSCCRATRWRGRRAHSHRPGPRARPRRPARLDPSARREALRALHWFNPLAWLRLAASAHRERARQRRPRPRAGRRRAGLRRAISSISRAACVARAAWVPAPAMIRPSSLEGRVRAMLDPTIVRRPVALAAAG